MATEMRRIELAMGTWRRGRDMLRTSCDVRAPPLGAACSTLPKKRVSNRSQGKPFSVRRRQAAICSSNRGTPAIHGGRCRRRASRDGFTACRERSRWRRERDMLRTSVDVLRPVGVACSTLPKKRVEACVTIATGDCIEPLSGQALLGHERALTPTVLVFLPPTPFSRPSEAGTPTTSLQGRIHGVS